METLSRAKARTASPERRVARASSHLPRTTRATITVPVSKYTWPSSIPATSTTADQTHAAVVPSDTRVSMVAARWRRLRTAAQWNPHPAPKITAAEATDAAQRQPSKRRGGIIDTAITGTPSTTAPTSLRRSAATRRSSLSSWLSGRSGAE